ncbi:MAG: trimethylamine methyltransferase family protein [Desulfobacterales bacterium]|nr:trimethylamine methyltransferase family protein [Desulfobacterales bacterium]
MKKRIGLSSGQYKPLKEEDLLKIHETSLRVFEEIGVKINLPEALEMFKKAGATVDNDSKIVKIPKTLFHELIKSAPSEIILYGRGSDGEFDCKLGASNVHLGTGGTALNVQDPGTEISRRAELKDISNMARLVESLENIHFYMLNVYPSDIKNENIDVNRFGAALNHTRKHIMGGVYTIQGIQNVIKMAAMIAGSPEKLREKPFISMVACVISAFVIDENYGRLAMEVAKHGIPLVTPTEPLCGATSPVTLAGNLVVQNVDTLTGIMLAQLVNPGTPVLYGCISSITDLRNMKYLAGAVEMGLLNAASAQMAQYYKIPIYATAGMSDAKLCDAQAGYESAITNLLVALAGGNLIHDAAGFIEFCMTASYDKLVIDNEIIGMVMRAVEGIEVNDETLAFDVIKKAGPGGHFVSSRHTRRHMRSEQYQPLLSDRSDRDIWKGNGSKDARARACEKVNEILNGTPTSYIPSEIRERLKTEIQGLESFIMN